MLDRISARNDFEDSEAFRSWASDPLFTDRYVDSRLVNSASAPCQRNLLWTDRNRVAALAGRNDRKHP